MSQFCAAAYHMHILLLLYVDDMITAGTDSCVCEEYRGSVAL